MRHRIFDEHVASYWPGAVSKAKEDILVSVGYPNCCILTKNGVFGAISTSQNPDPQDNSRYQLQDWLRENECMNIQVSQNGVNKVYYDKINDQLLVKTVAWYGWVLEDENAPEPFEKNMLLCMVVHVD